MLYYADRQRTVDPLRALARARDILADASDRSDRATKDRSLLRVYPELVGAAIALGEVHQAVADQLCPVEDDVHSEADLLAEAGAALGRCVYAARVALCGDDPAASERLARAAVGASRALVALERLAWPPTMRVRIPEGYAFYSLYPEMYFASLSRLAAEMPSPVGYFVVGIRSIGTSLGALCAGALSQIGHEARFETVRPRGHPFDRFVSLGTGLRDRLLRARNDSMGFIVVDEGPGLTCSSLVSACTALEDLGVAPDRIAVISAWRGAPSIYASEDLRARWARLRVLHTDAADAMDGWRALLPFVEGLAGLDAVAGSSTAWEWEVSDLSYGRWRELCYASPLEWPVVHRPSERTKLLLTRAQGIRLLAKFAGLGDYGEEKLARARALGEAGFCPPALGLAHGFLVHEYVEGRPLGRSDLSQALLERMVDYYSFVARRFSRPKAPRFSQLADLIVSNSRSALNVDATPFVESWREHADRIDSLALVELDGRPFPHEWIEARRGSAPAYLKTDGSDHFLDHTIVGEQSILWDLAGACEEWGMDAPQVESFLTSWERRTGDATARTLLDFYRAAYLAFRTAALHFAIHSTNDGEIRAALQQQQFDVNTRLSSVLAAALTRPAAQYKGH